MSSRSKKKLVPLSAASNKRVENSWTLLGKDSLCENNSFNIITLPHPSDGRPTKYALDENNKKMYEVVSFNEPYRSWFIGETVKSNGSLHMMTPINPLFLILPRLKELCATRAVPLEDLLSEKGFHKISRFVTDLDNVADLKGPEDLKAYKYNEEKTLTWLEDRVRKLAKVLKLKKLHVTSGAVSATFVTSNIDNESVDDEFFLKYAHGILSEYLQDDICESLEKRFEFKPDLVEYLAKKRKSEATETNESKKIKCEEICKENEINASNSTSNGFTEVKKQKALTAKEKARQKAASGTKTISMFFAKK